jgi:hypothetical protein
MKIIGKHAKYVPFNSIPMGWVFSTTDHGCRVTYMRIPTIRSDKVNAVYNCVSMSNGGLQYVTDHVECEPHEHAQLILNPTPFEGVSI